MSRNSLLLALAATLFAAVPALADPAAGQAGSGSPDAGE